MFRNILILALVLGLIIAGCSEKSQISHKVLTKAEIDEVIENVQQLPNIPVSEDEIAVIKTDFGTIEFEFYPDVAPNHCANFKKLANAGFYDGVTFHRVIPGFVIQGGDILSRDDNPMNDGTGDAGYKVDAEFSNLKHDRGVISTARAPHDINSAGTQFFICVSEIHHLDGQYTIFGKVNKGMDVVDKIVAVPRDGRDRPKENVYMNEVRVVKK